MLLSFIVRWTTFIFINNYKQEHSPMAVYILSSGLWLQPHIQGKKTSVNFGPTYLYIYYTITTNNFHLYNKIIARNKFVNKAYIGVGFLTSWCKERSSWFIYTTLSIHNKFPHH